MKQSIFNTRQRAEELLREAMTVWESGNSSDAIEGIDKDPVFSLFLTALAYQENEIDDEIAQIRSAIIDEFSRMLVPFESSHAVPATVVVGIQTSDKAGSMWIDSDTSFAIQESKFSFIPLLRTKIINCSISSILRLDNRRWKVSLKTREAIRDLTGLTFMIANHDFADLKLSCDGAPLQIIKPWDYADLPLSKCFSLDNVLYSSGSAFSMTNTGADLFAANGSMIFYIDGREENPAAIPRDHFELIFEFSGIRDSFVFNRENLVLNATVLANASLKSLTLSSEVPAARISGESGQFLQLLRPSDLQILREEPVTLRRVNAGRFDADQVVRLFETLLSRYHSDFYAFKAFESSLGTDFADQLHNILKKMSSAVESVSGSLAPGLYAILKDGANFSLGRNTSLELEYITTDASSVNTRLSTNMVLHPQGSPLLNSVTVLAEPVPGRDEIRDADSLKRLSRYYMTTKDRLVTPADIKVFCYQELAARYGLTSEIIRSVRVRTLRDGQGPNSGLSTQVFIEVSDDQYVKRSFEKLSPQAETILEKLIQVRSTTVYPVSVSIRIN